MASENRAGSGKTDFGTRTAPHMLVQHWRGEWEAPEIRPYGPISIDPLSKGLHYGQSVFEGMKAFRQADGSVALFRPRTHLERLSRSSQRLCMPAVDVEAVLASLLELVGRDVEHVPAHPGSLYIRPLLFSDFGALVPEPSETHLFACLLLPVGAYIDRPDGLRLRTETEAIRSAPGGTGSTKCGGNYAGAMQATCRAKDEGFDEIVWLDAHERSHLEEVGTMNVFCVRGETLVTPPLGDTILPGVTRRSVIELARDRGIEVAEERIPVHEAYWRDVREVLTCGTAVGVQGVSELVHRGATLFRGEGRGPFTSELGAALEAVRYGTTDDHADWRVAVP